MTKLEAEELLGVPIDLGGILALSNYFPKIRLLPIADDTLLSVTQDYTQILFMHNDSNLFHQIEQDETYTLKVIRVFNPLGGGLWKFEKIKQS